METQPCLSVSYEKKKKKEKKKSCVVLSHAVCGTAENLSDMIARKSVRFLLVSDPNNIRWGNSDDIHAPGLERTAGEIYKF